MQYQEFISDIKEKNSDQIQYLSVVEELARDVVSYLEGAQAEPEQFGEFYRMLIPEKIVQFRVDWKNDEGEIETNWGYRVQHSSARGPYKGGLRFDPSVSIDILKFLALEQTFKNALTGLPLGSGKGGADFNPKGRSNAEIERFCHAFINALYPYIGVGVDVPAGDIGVGSREIGYMIDAYKNISDMDVVATLTGKPVEQGGSHMRTEATGYGVVYLLEHALKKTHTSLEGKKVVISGAGNVATHVAEKMIHMRARVLTLSERDGYLLCGDGLTTDALESIKKCKQARKSLSEIADSLGYTYRAGKPWQEVQAEIYIPSATQNELDTDDAQAIVRAGALLVAEGANMPCTADAVDVLQDSDTIFLPAKAANAGGVAVSGLEMQQNKQDQQWSTEEVDTQLKDIMSNIFETIHTYGAQKDGSVDYLYGANIGGYVQVAKAMKESDS